MFVDFHCSHTIHLLIFVATIILYRQTVSKAMAYWLDETAFFHFRLDNLLLKCYRFLLPPRVRKKPVRNRATKFSSFGHMPTFSLPIHASGDLPVFRALQSNIRARTTMASLRQDLHIISAGKCCNRLSRYTYGEWNRRQARLSYLFPENIAPLS